MSFKRLDGDCILEQSIQGGCGGLVGGGAGRRGRLPGGSCIPLLQGLPPGVFIPPCFQAVLVLLILGFDVARGAHSKSDLCVAQTRDEMLWSVECACINLSVTQS